MTAGSNLKISAREGEGVQCDSNLPAQCLYGHFACKMMRLVLASLPVVQLTPVHMVGGLHVHRYVEVWLEHIPPFAHGSGVQ